MQNLWGSPNEASSSKESSPAGTKHHRQENAERELEEGADGDDSDDPQHFGADAIKKRVGLRSRDKLCKRHDEKSPAQREQMHVMNLLEMLDNVTIDQEHAIRFFRELLHHQEDYPKKNEMLKIRQHLFARLAVFQERHIMMNGEKQSNKSRDERVAEVLKKLLAFQLEGEAQLESERAMISQLIVHYNKFLRRNLAEMLNDQNSFWHHVQQQRVLTVFSLILAAALVVANFIK